MPVALGRVRSVCNLVLRAGARRRSDRACAWQSARARIGCRSDIAGRRTWSQHRDQRHCCDGRLDRPYSGRTSQLAPRGLDVAPFACWRRVWSRAFNVGSGTCSLAVDRSRVALERARVAAAWPSRGSDTCTFSPDIPRARSRNRVWRWRSGWLRWLDFWQFARARDDQASARAAAPRSRLKYGAWCERCNGSAARPRP